MIRKRIPKAQDAVISRDSTKKNADGTVEHTASELRDPVSMEDVVNPAYIGINFRRTFPLEAYASLQIGVSVTLPCMPTKKGIRKGKDRAAMLAERYFEEEIEHMLGTE